MMTFPSNASIECKLPSKDASPKVSFRQQKPGLTAKGDERQFVQHNYTDHANKEDELIGTYGTNLTERYELSRYNKNGNEEFTETKGKPSPLFPLKLYMILDEVERKCKGNVINWLPHGRAFHIRNNDLFARQILPEYFKNCKISSFYRQLNLYGFVRLTAGFDTGAYYHEYFLRGKPFLTRNIIRTKVKGTKIRAASSPEDEPDFYSMPTLHSSPAVSKIHPLEARATDAHVPQQTWPVPQRISLDHSQSQFAHVPMQSPMWSYNNPHSITYRANDHTFANLMHHRTSLLGVNHSSPISVDAVHGNPHSYHNPTYAATNTSIVPAPHLYGDTLLHRTPSYISPTPLFYRDSPYPVKSILDHRVSPLNQNSQTLIPPQAANSTHQMSLTMRALDMYRPTSSPNTSPPMHIQRLT